MTRRQLHYAAVCALCVITILAYANSFRAGFALDNGFLLLGDTRIRTTTLANLALIFNHTYFWPFAESGAYRPLTTLSYLFNYAILGNTNHAAGYHWINLLLHAGNVLLVFALARRIVSDFWPSFLIAAVWAVHPVLTESVTNMVGRADLLAGMAILGGLLVYLKSAESQGSLRWAWLAGLAAIAAAGVFSKENAVALLAVVALYEFTWWKPERLRGFLLGCLAISPALLAMWLVRSKVGVTTDSALVPFVDNPIAGADFWTGRLTALKVMGKYLALLIWPAHLSPDYSYRQIPLATGTSADWIAWIAVASVMVAAVAFLYCGNKTAFFAAGFAFVTLLPTANLVIPVGTIMAERFLYLPAIGLAVWLTMALFWLGGKVPVRGVAPAVLLLVIAAFVARTWNRNADWRDDLTLWSAAVQTSPLSFKTHAALAKALLLEKEPDGERIYKEDQTSLALLDSLPDQLNNAPQYYDIAAHYILIGDSLRRLYGDGQTRTGPESIAKYQRARAVLLRSKSILTAQHKDPGAYTYLMLSQIDHRLGKTDDALQSAREARDLQPLLSAAYIRIHDVLLSVRRKDEAIAALMEGLVLTSDPAVQGKVLADYAGSSDEDKCAIEITQGVTGINFSCPIVHKLLCSTSDEMNRLALKSGDPNTAARVKSELATRYACSEIADRQ